MIWALVETLCHEFLKQYVLPPKQGYELFDMEAILYIFLHPV